MRNILVLYMSVLSAIVMCAQNEVETYSYAHDNYIEMRSDIPVIRSINGGTVFNITYEGNWSFEMQGAFEYACKIWEETLPSMLPINITAKIGTIRGSNNQKTLSKVVVTAIDSMDHHNNAYKSLTPQIKPVVLSEYEYGYNTQFVSSIRDSSFFNLPDITITYNINLLDSLSYSLYSTPVDKYDFVSVVLRDIARGLGFFCDLYANTNEQKILFTGRLPTYYESLIRDAIGSSDPFIAYANATNGSLPLSIYGYGTSYLYAPSTWINGLSLNVFIPDSTKKITTLLSDNFGRGTVNRDITDTRLNNLFENGLKWDKMILTGTIDCSPTVTGSTSNVIPYGGQINIAFEVDDLLSIQNNFKTSNIHISQRRDNPNVWLNELCWNYDCFYRPGYSPNDKGSGWAVSALLKDGKWDVVYSSSSVIPLLNVSMGNFAFHYSQDAYSRTCDGYLRFRVTYCIKKWDFLYETYYYEKRVNYYAVDYLPQKVKMNYAYSLSDVGDYFEEIKIDIKNLEGLNRIVVEQLDEGDDIPSRFEVTDFKKGFFTAIIDKWLYSQFTIVSYNNNGNIRSDTIEIAPSEFFDLTGNLSIKNDEIKIISNLRERDKKNSFLSYEIRQIGTHQNEIICNGVFDNEYPNINSIKINNLNSGLYVLHCFGKKNRKCHAKFRIN